MQLIYRIKEVDALDEDIAETLADLHRLTFFESAPTPEFDWGHWWLAAHGRVAVAFAGLIPSTYVSNAGYFCRVGVLKRHCGRSAADAAHAGNGIAGTPQRLEMDYLGYDGQSRIRK